MIHGVTHYVSSTYVHNNVMQTFTFDVCAMELHTDIVRYICYCRHARSLLAITFGDWGCIIVDVDSIGYSPDMQCIKNAVFLQVVAMLV